MSAYGILVRIYHEDVDTLGVVYHANYLKYYERARTDYLRSEGFLQDELKDRYGIMFVVRSIKIDYLQPARYSDLLWVTADVISLRRTSFEFDQKTYIENEQGNCVNQATVSVVCVDQAKLRPCPIPVDIVEMFGRAQ